MVEIRPMLSTLTLVADVGSSKHRVLNYALQLTNNYHLYYRLWDNLRICNVILNIRRFYFGVSRKGKCTVVEGQDVFSQNSDFWIDWDGLLKHQPIEEQTRMGADTKYVKWYEAHQCCLNKTGEAKMEPMGKQRRGKEKGERLLRAKCSGAVQNGARDWSAAFAVIATTNSRRVNNKCQRIKNSVLSLFSNHLCSLHH